MHSRRRTDLRVHPSACGSSFPVDWPESSTVALQLSSECRPRTCETMPRPTSPQELLAAAETPNHGGAQPHVPGFPARPRHGEPATETHMTRGCNDGRGDSMDSGRHRRVSRFQSVAARLASPVMYHWHTLLLLDSWSRSRRSHI